MAVNADRSDKSCAKPFSHVMLCNLMCNLLQDSGANETIKNLSLVKIHIIVQKSWALKLFTRWHCALKKVFLAHFVLNFDVKSSWVS